MKEKTVKIHSQEEAVLKRAPNWVKYLWEPRNKAVYMFMEDGVTDEDIVQSVLGIISTVYSGYKENPDNEDYAQFFKDEVIAHINSEDFWEEEDDEKTVYLLDEEVIKEGILS